MDNQEKTMKILDPKKLSKDVIPLFGPDYVSPQGQRFCLVHINTLRSAVKNWEKANEAQ